jgi:tetratricopeptide (TPR) repeat protein
VGPARDLRHTTDPTAKVRGALAHLLGQALARLRRREEAFEALRSAVEIADDLVGAPARWHARAALGEASYTLGDDETAVAAYDEAASLVESFAGRWRRSGRRA